MKSNGCKQALDHVQKLKALKEFDDAHIINAIQILEGRMPKTLQLASVNMRSQYITLLQQLRRAQELVKAVKQSENEMKVTKQVPQA